jgi:hypothetical protein
VDSFAAVLDASHPFSADVPIMVCQQWSLDEVGLDCEASREAYRRLLDCGFVPCQVYSALEPEGEYGHLDAEQLHPISEGDFRIALELLASRHFDRFERHVCSAVCARLHRRSLAREIESV